jgi:CPA1 family monovalent cation:H+ antiporter
MTVLEPFDLAAAIVVLAAVLGYLNHRTLRLPNTTSLTIMGAIASSGVIALDHAFPGIAALDAARDAIHGIDFRATLFDGLLSFLLFAGALHINLDELKREGWSVLAFTTVGVALSTVIVGVGFYVPAQMLDLNIPLIWCLVFGALISPTDPVAVISILKRAGVPRAIEAAIAGESLFNDGVAVVLFTVLLSAATATTSFSAIEIGELFFREAIGGIVFGLAIGGFAYFAMRSIDEHNLEVTITLALVMGGYALADRLHVNGPIAMAAAGVVIGSYGSSHGVSANTRDYITKFWGLIDEILNSALFLLIGIEVIVVPTALPFIALAVSAIPIGLAARAISVGVPMLLLSRFSALPRSAFWVLFLGGLRGGISLAMALSLPGGPMKDAILVATYAMVLFSVVIQGGTVAAAARRLFGPSGIKERRSRNGGISSRAARGSGLASHEQRSRPAPLHFESPHRQRNPGLAAGALVPPPES